MPSPLKPEKCKTTLRLNFMTWSEPVASPEIVSKYFLKKVLPERG